MCISLLGVSTDPQKDEFCSTLSHDASKPRSAVEMGIEGCTGLNKVQGSKCKNGRSMQGEALARRLYMDAVMRKSIPGDPNLIDYIRRIDPENAVSGSQAAPVSAPAAVPEGVGRTVSGAAVSRQPPDPAHVTIVSCTDIDIHIL